MSSSRRQQLVRHNPEFTGIHPAFPLGQNGKLIAGELNGLTKREYVASQLLGGLLAGRRAPSAKTFNKLAREAIAHADELLRQLQETGV